MEDAEAVAVEDSARLLRRRRNMSMRGRMVIEAKVSGGDASIRHYRNLKSFINNEICPTK